MPMESRRLISKLQNILLSSGRIESIRRLCNKDNVLHNRDKIILIISILIAFLIIFEFIMRSTICRNIDTKEDALYGIVENTIVLLVLKRQQKNNFPDLNKEEINNKNRHTGNSTTNILVLLRTIQYFLFSYCIIFQDNFIQIIFGYSKFYESVFNTIKYIGMLINRQSDIKITRMDILKFTMFLGYVFSSAERNKSMSFYLVFLALLLKHLELKYKKKLESYNSPRLKEKTRIYRIYMKMMCLMLLFVIRMEYRSIFINLQLSRVFKFIIGLNIIILLKFIDEENKKLFSIARRVLIFISSSILSPGKTICQYLFIVGILITNLCKNRKN